MERAEMIVNLGKSQIYHWKRRFFIFKTEHFQPEIAHSGTKMRRAHISFTMARIFVIDVQL